MKKFVFATALAVCAATLISIASAQDMSKKVLPTMRMQMAPAVERTPAQMDAADATALAPGNREVPFRPTMDATLYAQYKHAAELAPHGTRPSGGNAPSPLAAIASKFAGATECDNSGTGFGCWAPPDVAGSIGKTQFVSVSNNTFEVRSRGGVLQRTNSLNGLMGYTNQPLFDPRVQYDEEYQRWIITAAAFPESNTVQYLFIAVSTTSSASGSYWIYVTNVNFIGGAGSFYDYPGLGMSQDAILFTANIFLPNNGFQGATLWSVAKARLYNGFGFGYPVFTGLAATLQPGHQLLTDQNPYAWVAAAPGGSSTITMYALGFGSNAFSAFYLGPYTVSGVAAYGVPPAAAQPAACGAGANLDTLDNRFQNTGTQTGDRYYQVHTTGDFGVPTPRFYIISGLLSFAPAVAVQQDFYASGSSYDFNPSIASNDANFMGINWSVTDPPANLFASEYFADDNGVYPGAGSGIRVFTNAACYTGVGTNRWGDYSQTSLDPGTGTRATYGNHIFWIDNEIVQSTNFWTTEIAKVKF